MNIFNKVKHYAFAFAAGLSTPDPVIGDSVAGDAVGMVKDFFAEWGFNSSVQRQLLGIEQSINSGLVDLGPYAARRLIKYIPTGVIENRSDCSVYDSMPCDEMMERSGALVFVKYYSDSFGVVRDPVVELVGFGADVKSAWSNAMQLPRISSEGQGQFQKEKSYFLWYQFKLGKLEKSEIPYPFYLSAVKP